MADDAHGRLGERRCEIIQGVFAIGASDIDDVILNCVGGIMGILTFRLLSVILRDEYQCGPRWPCCHCLRCLSGATSFSSSDYTCDHTILCFTA